MVTTWVENAEGSGFGIENLPYGAFSVPGSPESRIGVRIGSKVLDVRPLAERGRLPIELSAPNLNPLLDAGKSVWDEVRETLSGLLSGESERSAVEPLLVPLDQVTMRMPFTVGDYVDFYSSEEHATNIGKMFRPDSEPLLPNWKHLPVGYHGRSGTVVVSGTPIRRPTGQLRGADGPTFGPTRRLDIELEMGFVIGGSTSPGESIPIEQADLYIFGMMLVNDWSARDIQAWEYVPLGPFLGKSFATSISPWIVPMAALEYVRLAPPTQHPDVFDYLRTDRPWGFDIDLDVRISTAEMRARGDESVTVSKTNFRHMYWTAAQQLAHLTVNGATVRSGDLCASGTISGSDPDSLGSFIELSSNGTRPITLADGTTRTFLEDGDEITLAGHAGSVSLGEVVGRIVS